MSAIPMKHAGSAVHSPLLTAHADASVARLADVWNDTVDTRHLGLALLISVPVSAGCFLLANMLFQQWVATPQIARAYAMLCGLLGCILGGAICAAIFKPKRIIVEEATDASALQDVINELRSDVGGLGKLADIPASTLVELKSLGLHDLFRDAEAEDERRAAKKGT